MIYLFQQNSFHKTNYLFSTKHCHIAHEQIFICEQLFTDQVVIRNGNEERFVGVGIIRQIAVKVLIQLSLTFSFDLELANLP